MSEQFVTAYMVSIESLYGLVGCKQPSVIEKTLAQEAVDEVGDLLEDGDESLEETLQELVTGRMRREHAYGYRRLLELFLPLVGKALEPQGVTLPGRGWQELGAALPAWGLPALAEAWCPGRFHFPWRRRSSKVSVDWPVVMAIDSPTVSTLARELKAFDPFGFGDLMGMPEMPVLPPLPERLEGCGYEALFLVAKVREWMTRAARSRGKDVVILLDGQQ